jgi:hypothetical protein
MFRTVKDYQMPAPSPDSVAGSEGRRVITRRSINDGFRRAAAVHWHRDEGPLATLNGPCMRDEELTELMGHCAHQVL